MYEKNPAYKCMKKTHIQTRIQMHEKTHIQTRIQMHVKTRIQMYEKNTHSNE